MRKEINKQTILRESVKKAILKENLRKILRSVILLESAAVNNFKEIIDNQWRNNIKKISLSNIRAGEPPPWNYLTASSSGLGSKIHKGRLGKFLYFFNDKAISDEVLVREDEEKGEVLKISLENLSEETVENIFQNFGLYEDKAVVMHSINTDEMFQEFLVRMASQNERSRKATVELPAAGTTRDTIEQRVNPFARTEENPAVIPLTKRKLK